MSEDTRNRQWARRRRSDCPGADLLDEYRRQVLDKSRTESIEAHLRQCPACINELIDLREFAVLEDAAQPAPEQLLQRVRQTTAQHLAGASADSPAASQPQPAKVPWLERLREWWHQPALSGAAAAALVLAVAFFITTSQPDDLLDVDLLPRGEQLDQQRLRSLLDAVRDDGVAAFFPATGTTARVQLSGTTDSGLQLTPLTSGQGVALQVRPLTAADTGTTVIGVNPDHKVFSAVLVRQAEAEWQSASGHSHQGALIELQTAAAVGHGTAVSRSTAASRGAAILDLQLRLLAVVVLTDTDTQRLYAVPVPAGPGP